MSRNIILIVLFAAGFISYCVNFRTGYLQYKVRKSVSVKKLYGRGAFNKLTEYLSQICEKHLKLSEEKREQMQAMMRISLICGTPEQYVATTYAYVLCITLLGIILYLITMLPLALALPIIAGYFILRHRDKQLRNEFEAVQQQVAKDLPKLCSVIKGKLSYMSSAEHILKSFLPVANSTMGHQIGITLADMRSGNVATALQRFENRIHLARLSDICRGLTAANNGDDQRVYFEIKANELAREYENQIELEIAKRPGKLRKNQFIMVGVFVGAVAYPLYLFMQQQLSIFN